LSGLLLQLTGRLHAAAAAAAAAPQHSSQGWQQVWRLLLLASRSPLPATPCLPAAVVAFRKRQHQCCLVQQQRQQLLLQCDPQAAPRETLPDCARSSFVWTAAA
jgi:hypothetical protein